MRIHTLVASAALCAFGANLPIAGSAAPAGCSTLVLTGHPSYAPIAWADGGILQGAAIDVMRQVAAENGVKLRVVNEGSWNAAQMAVRDGRAGAIVGLYQEAAQCSSHTASPAVGWW